MSRALIILALTIAAIQPLAAADYREQHNLKISGDSLDSFSINVGAGRLDIVGDPDAQEIRVQATIVVKGFNDKDAKRFAKENVRVELYRKGTKSNLVAEIDHRDRSWLSRVFSGNTSAYIDVEVTVPPGIHLNVDDGSGDLEISNLRQSVELDDGSGNADIRNIRGSLSVDDGSGDLEIREIDGDLDIEDGSGNVEINDVSGDLSIDDGSGDLEITRIGGSVEVDDGSGDIRIDTVTRDVRIIDSGSGDLRIARVEGAVQH